MLASMYSAVSGLQSHQTKMNVIGNNIANVNTYGFKKSRATFTDVFYQTLSGSSAASTNAGGTNPSQLGYGATVNSVDVIHKTAGSSTTDRALDVYINGDGYLAVRDSNGTINYTRVGILSFDASGNLVDSNGSLVLGFNLDETTGQPQLDSDGTTTVQNLKERISVPVDELDRYSSISIGQKGEITAIKQGNQAFSIGQSGWVKSADEMDKDNTLTGSVTVEKVENIAMAYTDADAADSFTTDTTETTLNAVGEIKFRSDVATAGDITDKAKYTLEYTDKDGRKQTQTAFSSVDDTDATKNVITFRIPNEGKTYNAAEPATYTEFKVTASDTDLKAGPISSVAVGKNEVSSADITISTFNKAGQKVTSSTPWTNSSAQETTPLNFNSDSGSLSLEIKNKSLAAAFEDGLESLNGDIIGTIAAGDGVAVKIAQLALATFTNEGGLTQNGQGYFLPSNNSGTAVIKVPGTGGTGSLRSGALEMSNVDLSFEFTEMIICQRGFQANTKMITVSDEMLSELVSMKR